MFPQFFRDQVAADVGARDQHLAAAHLTGRTQRAHDRLRPVLGGRQIHLQSCARQPLGGRGPDDAEPDALERAQILGTGQQPIDERVDGVRAREDDPVELSRVRARLVERPVVVRGDDADHGGFDCVGAHGLQRVDEPARLLARTRHQDALAEQRPRVEPPEVLAQRGHAPDDENGRPSIARLLDGRQQLFDRADDGLLGRKRAVVHDGG